MRGDRLQSGTASTNPNLLNHLHPSTPEIHPLNPDFTPFIAFLLPQSLVLNRITVKGTTRWSSLGVQLK
jgi:hypothetical protein